MSNPDFTTYFNSPLFSDATLSYQTHTGDKRHLPVHRLILSLHSPFFASAFTLPFRESSDPDHLLTLHDDDPDALVSAIRWCYGHSLYQLDGDDELETQLAYKDLITMKFTAEEEQQIAGLLLHLMRVYVVADKYDLGRLREEVVVHYERLAPLVLLHKQGMFEEMVEVVYGLGKGDKLRRRFLGDVAREVYPVAAGKDFKNDKMLKKGNDWELEEVEKVVRASIFKVRTVGMGREWKKEFMRDMKREVRREVKKSQAQSYTMDKRFLSSDEKLLESGLFSDVVVKCGDRTWNLHKNILCSRSIWFEKALTGHFEEAKTGVVNIENFEPAAIDILIRYIYTGICDIPALSPHTKTNFVSCFEVYTVGDYFALASLTRIALDTLNAEFDAKIAPLQLHYDSGSSASDGNGVSPDWLPELFEAIRLVYNEVPLTDTSPPTPGIRATFLSFIHAARFYFLQNEHFNAFLDQVPSFALDVFRAMRNTGDFIAHLPDAHCSLCKSKPTRAEKGYYTHLATEKLKLKASCSTCAGKRDLSAGWTDWSGKLSKATTTATGTTAAGSGSG
ncbi:hypothetical protein GE21DRAFT_9561 [Neurospora crassa]|uniref:BTB domain-containing protein n=1 Tax=Neurospora crassa (strain ATCC 24698 / 74-OR23-1A / CBS 708.71 / DSM 1257 / FGSC 987) TaxID=367110 RepID=Q7RX44_NEUCR|nr:hypothetical protein NCU05044 [Neurospora crassa OR74A]EAA27116.2 hypothetical protein NCU05044 [Neurospora crassa OR74A]KHE83827.1 hypothetical protein GE21DRAFT_9561 [Neurospora crassa]|eukprot:XP_956352.2 hypothetical protein NCU05044 [Neurospora crassa OR74A]